MSMNSSQLSLLSDPLTSTLLNLGSKESLVKKQSIPAAAPMDQDTYRLVPYRFCVGETESESCRLEKLGNLFPDMKAVIELELFKSNNLARLIERLSNVYAVVTALNTRDDTLHLFLGPYHLALGPATFAALRFKNVSAALLDATSSVRVQLKHKRRHEMALRRFRRAVQKLILIKSIVDQIRLASVLTPYNQQDLHARGIYNMALAGHLDSFQSMANTDYFTEEIDRLRAKENPSDRSSLRASSFIKINTLLHLLSPTEDQKPFEMNPVGENMHKSRDLGTMRSESSNNLNASDPSQKQSSDVFPIQQPGAPLLLSLGLPGVRNFQRSASALSRQNTASSITSSVGSDDYVPIKSASTFPRGLYSFDRDIDPSKIVAAALSTGSPCLSPTNEEEAVINRMSSLLTSYLLSRQSSTMKDDGSTHPAVLITTPSADQSSVAVTNLLYGIDTLLHQVKTVVEYRLSNITSQNHQGSSPMSPQTTTKSQKYRQKMFASQKTRDSLQSELDVERSSSSAPSPKPVDQNRRYTNF